MSDILSQSTAAEESKHKSQAAEPPKKNLRHDLALVLNTSVTKEQVQALVTDL